MIIISGILSYSGISAKARAMGGKLLKKEQYEQLASCASVGEAVGYLRQFSEYEPLLRDFDEHDSHRGMIEATLMGSLYNDYNRLYSFARGEQRAFLDFYFLLGQFTRDYTQTMKRAQRVFCASFAFGYRCD